MEALCTSERKRRSSRRRRDDMPPPPLKSEESPRGGKQQARRVTLPLQPSNNDAPKEKGQIKRKVIDSVSVFYSHDVWKHDRNKLHHFLIFYLILNLLFTDDGSPE